MAFNGSGTFLPLAPPQFPAVTGQVISAAYFNAVINDMLNNGLSKVLVNDGQSTMSGVLKLGGNLVSGLANPVGAQDAATKFYVDNAAFTAGGVGAVTRTIYNKLADVVSIRDYGVVGDGVADDSAAIRNAVVALGDIGTLIIPPGNYKVKQDGVNPWCIKIPATIRIVGVATPSCTINPDITVPATCDILRFIPSTLYQNRAGGVSNISVLNPVNGTRYGRDAIRVDTVLNGDAIDKFLIFNIATGVAASGGYGIHFYNNPINQTGGTFGATIRDCAITGGIFFENTGDSNGVENCIITGSNVGVTFTNIAGTNGSGSQGFIHKCNITNSGGAIQVNNSPGISILYNNIEHIAAGSGVNGNAVVYFAAPAAWSGATAYTVSQIVQVGGIAYNCIAANTNFTPPNATYWAVIDPFAGSSIRGNLISNFGTSDATTMVRVDFGTTVDISGNRVLAGFAGIKGITIGAGAKNTSVTSNIFPVGAAVTDRVINNGIATINIDYPVTKNGAWVDVVNYPTITVTKSSSGLVTFRGTIGSGTFGGSNAFVTVPPGFIPAVNQKFQVSIWNGTNYVSGEMWALTTGAVISADGYSGTPTKVEVNATWRAADSADGTV